MTKLETIPRGDLLKWLKDGMNERKTYFFPDGTGSGRTDDALVLTGLIQAQETSRLATAVEKLCGVIESAATER